MTERLGSARGALTIAQAQELILAQAEAARRALPQIQRPSMAQSFIPIVGPAWEAAADFKDGEYGAAGFNALMAVADALPVGVAVKGLNAARKGVGYGRRARSRRRPPESDIGGAVWPLPARKFITQSRSPEFLGTPRIGGTTMHS